MSKRVTVVGAASLSPTDRNAVLGNTLIVVASPDGQGERIYWRGERLDGRIDHNRSMRRSMTNPGFVMLIDGRHERFGNDDVMCQTFVFRGETLTSFGGGFSVDFDEAADRPVF